ncbi:MAG: alpha-beta hydrolase superfamily esterase-like protein [Rhizobacter sp.]|nr:alpha-beta hydrolase superfamily esterase-like protein [Rhizobacter sp.]
MSGFPAPAGQFGGLAGPRAQKGVSLALQGCGAHGAFSWGVLDALIEDDRLAFEAITGASAGSMNAVVMADGWIEGGPDGARSQLEAFWRHVSLDGGLTKSQREIFDMFLGCWSLGGSSPMSTWLNAWSSAFSPYQTNPLDINPLRDVLDDLVNFDRLRASEVKLFVSATNVWTGKGRIFETRELKVEHVMASACLPTVFKAVEVDGEPYWDGGYSGNPAIYPLIYNSESTDIVLVKINPLFREGTPSRSVEIIDRLSEITFNAGLIAEMRAISFVSKLMREGKLDAGRYKDLRLHMVADDEGLAPFSASTKFNTDRAFLEQLFALGRTAADHWLAAHKADIGKRSSLDIDAEFLGGKTADTSVQTPMPATAQKLLESLKDSLH